MTNTAVWALLLLLTLAETAMAWAGFPPGLMLALLLLVSTAKAAFIAWYFMHLRLHCPRPLALLIGALIVCVGLLLALLPDGVRAGVLR